MKKVLENLSFADSSYISCQTNNNEDLLIYIESWDNKIIKVLFQKAIQFKYNGGDFIAGIFEEIKDKGFLFEALSNYYQKIPEDHHFKMYAVIDIRDNYVFEIVAEKVTATKENNF